MKNATKIQQFLRSQGVNESTPKAVVQNLKTLYWKQERVRRNKENRAGKKEVRFTLPLSEWNIIEQEAQAYNMTVTEYARRSVQAHKDKVYMSPNIPALSRLEKEVHKVGINVNTALEYMHLTRNYGESDKGLGKLREELNILFRMLQESIEQKPELYTWLQEDLETNPERLERVKIIINNIKSNASSKE